MNEEVNYCGAPQGNYMRRQVLREVVLEVTDMFAIPKITEATNLKEDLGADSLDMEELFLALESRFGCRISDFTLHYARPPKTVAEVVEVVLDTLKN